jgi:hypothetical protein
MLTGEEPSHAAASGIFRTFRVHPSALMTTVTRRQFGERAAAAFVATAIGSSRVRGANDRVRLGFIGVGNRGDQVLDAFFVHKDAEIAGICDIYQPYLDFAAQKAGATPRGLPITAGCSR